MRVKDADLIRWFRDLLISNTTAGTNVYAWRKISSNLEDSPLINITLDRRTFERDDARGADIENKRLAVITLVKGLDDAATIDQNDSVIEKLDDLEVEVLDLIDYDLMPPSGPEGVLRANLVEISTEREETNKLYAARYFIFAILTKYNPKRR